MSGESYEPPPEPITFDRILPAVRDCLRAHAAGLGLDGDHAKYLRILGLGDGGHWAVVNRDLNGRARLILPERIKENDAPRGLWENLAADLRRRLGAHGAPGEAGIIFEASRESACLGAASYPLDGFPGVWLADRLAAEADWTRIRPETEGPPRIVFFSIKGGVGRSTALAATAWHLAQREGKRVLALDLDLESPGLSPALLAPERQPRYGIADWLVEDLVDNGEAVFDGLVAASDLSHDGEIHIAPAHGAEHGEYVAKLGRVWMPKARADGTRETWPARLGRLLQALEERIKPDVTLIDSRSGLDEIASACLADMGANLILLFALEGRQTWNGYRMLFERWQFSRAAEAVRERLRLVAALVPELDRHNYLQALRENAYPVFADTLYDEISPPELGSAGPDGGGGWRVGELVEGFNFDEADEGAPHSPWAVNWRRGFASLLSLQGRLARIDATEAQSVFGPLLEGVSAAAERTA